MSSSTTGINGKTSHAMMRPNSLRNRLSMDRSYDFGFELVWLTECIRQSLRLTFRRGSRRRRFHGDSLVFPEPVLELREERQRVAAKDLPADRERMLFPKVTAVDPFGKDLGQAAAGHLDGA